MNVEWKLSLFLEFELSVRYLTRSFKGQLNKWIWSVGRVQGCDLKHPVEMIKGMGGGEINPREEVELASREWSPEGYMPWGYWQQEE